MMAQRRMFSKTIIESARFLKMPIESQVLYFHLGLRADDDGVVEAYPVLKILGTAEDALRVLVAKQFIKILNEDLVAYIIDWNEHNTIRADRKVDSIYKNLLIQMLPDAKPKEPKPRADTGKTTGRTMDNQRTAQVRLGKDSIGEDTKDMCDKSRDIAFNTFWTLYDKKRNKAKCITLWQKVSPDNYNTIFEHVKRYVASTPEVAYRKDPERYIKYQCWNDEIITGKGVDKNEFGWCHD